MRDFFEEVLNRFLKAILIIAIIISVFIAIFCIAELTVVFKFIGPIICLFVDCIIWTILGWMEW